MSDNGKRKIQTLGEQPKTKTLRLQLDADAQPFAVWVCFGKPVDVPPGSEALADLPEGEREQLVAVQMHSQFRCFPSFEPQLAQILDLMEDTVRKAREQSTPANDRGGADGSNEG